MKDREPTPTIAAALRTSTSRMAEPQHRIAPPGASTGQSVRSYPKSCIDQVKDVCLFYVNKCSGKYQDNVTAARYVHQMAEEVISLLAGVAGEIKRNKSEPEVLQALLDEWNEHFPPSLGAMGSPKAIAAIVASQSVELNDLRAALGVERDKRDKDVSEVLRSMEAQLQAYRNSVMSERRLQAIKERQQTEMYENSIKDLQKSNQDQLDRLTQSSYNDMQQIKTNYESQLQSVNRTIEKAKQQMKACAEHYKTRLERSRASKNRKFEKLLNKYKVAQDKYYQLACTVQDDPSVLSSASFDENTTIGSSSRADSFVFSDLESDLDDEEDEPVPDFTTLNATTTMTSAVERGRRRGYDETKVDTDGRESPETRTSPNGGRKKDSVKFVPDKSETVSVTPSVVSSQTARPKVNAVKYDVKLAADIRIKYLLEQIDQLKNEGVTSTMTIESLNTEIARLHAEIERYLILLKELETMNEAYRCSIALKLNIPPHPDLHTSPQTSSNIDYTRGKKSGGIRSGDNKVLCHTPHFLGPADKKGCMSNHPVLHGYNVAGRF